MWHAIQCVCCLKWRLHHPRTAHAAGPSEAVWTQPQCEFHIFFVAIHSILMSLHWEQNGGKKTSCMDHINRRQKSKMDFVSLKQTAHGELFYHSMQERTARTVSVFRALRRVGRTRAPKAMQNCVQLTVYFSCIFRWVHSSFDHVTRWLPVTKLHFRWVLNSGLVYSPVQKTVDMGWRVKLGWTVFWKRTCRQIYRAEYCLSLALWSRIACQALARSDRSCSRSVYSSIWKPYSSDHWWMESTKQFVSQKWSFGIQSKISSRSGAQWSFTHRTLSYLSHRCTEICAQRTPNQTTFHQET